jgi:hypothetical protein
MYAPFVARITGNLIVNQSREVLEPYAKHPQYTVPFQPLVQSWVTGNSEMNICADS